MRQRRQQMSENKKAGQPQDLSTTDTSFTTELVDPSRAAQEDDELLRTMSRSMGELSEADPPQQQQQQLLNEKSTTSTNSPSPDASTRSDVSIWSPEDQYLNDHQERSDSVRAAATAATALTEYGNHAEPSEIEQRYKSLAENQTTLNIIAAEGIKQHSEYYPIADSNEVMKHALNATTRNNQTNPLEQFIESTRPAKKIKRKKKRKQKVSMQQPANQMVTYVSHTNFKPAKKPQRVVYKPDFTQQLTERLNDTRLPNPSQNLSPLFDPSAGSIQSYNHTDLITQTSILLNSAIKGPFHLENDQQLAANYNNQLLKTNTLSTENETTATASSTEANSFVDMARPELPMSTGLSPGISPADHDQLMSDTTDDPDSTDSDLNLDSDDDEDHKKQTSPAKNAPNHWPHDGITQSSSVSGSQQQQNGVLKFHARQQPSVSHDNGLKPAIENNSKTQEHLDGQANQLNTSMAGDSSPSSNKTPATTLSHELLVGPFKSESEAPATITLEGVVYQKSGVSSALIKSGSVKQYKQPGANDGLSTSGSSSSTVNNQQQQHSALVDTAQPVTSTQPQSKLVWSQPSGAATLQGQPTLDAAAVQVSPNNNILFGSIKSLTADQVAASVSGQQQHDLETTDNHMPSVGFRFNPVQSSVSNLFSLLSPFSSPNTQFVVASPPHGQSASLETIDQLRQLNSFKQKQPTLPSGFSVGEPLSPSSSGGQDPRGTTTIWVGKNSQLSSAAAPSSNTDLQQMLASESTKHSHKNKDKGGPIVLVQKDVKPVKYHLLRAYLKLRRLLRPFEATYVFPNDSNGFLRRWLNKRSQTN